MFWRHQFFDPQNSLKIAPKYGPNLHENGCNLGYTGVGEKFMHGWKGNSKLHFGLRTFLVSFDFASFFSKMFLKNQFFDPTKWPQKVPQCLFWDTKANQNTGQACWYSKRRWGLIEGLLGYILSGGHFRKNLNNEMHSKIKLPPPPLKVAVHYKAPTQTFCICLGGCGRTKIPVPPNQIVIWAVYAGRTSHLCWTLPPPGS